MKTTLTLEMEEALYYYCRENSDIVIERGNHAGRSRNR